MPIYIGSDEDTKLAELTLYIAKKSEGDSTFGSTKLNKLLFFADFLAYLNWGKPITEQEYQCIERGPAPRRIVIVKEDLMRKGEATKRIDNYFGFPQEKFITLREPNLDNFTGNEIDLVNSIINQWWGITARQISDYSHNFIGWQNAEEGETIKYETALVSDRELSAEEMEYANKIDLSGLGIDESQLV